jgi:hypothetical protein
LYECKENNDNEMYKDYIEKKINEYRGVNNTVAIDEKWLLL